MTRRPRPKRRAPRKAANPPREPLDDFIVAGAHSLGLTIDKTWMVAVREHLQVTLRHGALVAEFDLSDEAEPAPVFEA